MSFGASDIQKKEFTVSVLRGYRMSEVDEFLDLVAGQLEKLQQENDFLKSRVAQLEARPSGGFTSAQPELSDLSRRLEDLEKRIL